MAQRNFRKPASAEQIIETYQNRINDLQEDLDNEENDLSPASRAAIQGAITYQKEMIKEFKRLIKIRDKQLKKRKNNL